MTTVIAEHDVTVLHGDVREQLATLPDGSVQCVCTSPPYFGLRDYGTGSWDGGDPDCDHAGPPKASQSSGLKNDGRPNPGRKEYEMSATVPFRDTCGLCGARRVDRQIGLEPSPAEYVETLRGVFADVRRVLADDGVLWLNLGDSYSSPLMHNDNAHNMNRAGTSDAKARAMGAAMGRVKRPMSLPAKNLLGVPWRVAFALQDDGWTLRNAVVWSKPNAMPESVTDRLSSRYEHVFLFSKQRRYWFNLDAIREQAATADRGGPRRSYAPGSASSMKGGQHQVMSGPFAGLPLNENGRNPGDVWEIATVPYSGAHFACMPPALARRGILAGCPDDGTVLDPFAGSGTTLMVARQLGRKSVGIELNAAYIDIIRDRIGQTPLDFGEAAS